MPTHHEVKRLPYSAAQMYDLVADVAAYPKFLPWNSAARIRSRTPVTGAKGETGEVMEIDTGDPEVRAAWGALGEQRQRDLIATFRRSQVPELEVRTDQPWPQRLQKFLDYSAKRRVA